ncbi:MAG: Carbon monoxide oxidation accessory protein CoxG, partial [Deltaproteobacteria bacterium]|nr:Carbon monoxide oxidation accessory protein CoxG [Deltaproteobacteria bacterium]
MFDLLSGSVGSWWDTPATPTTPVVPPHAAPEPTVAPAPTTVAPAPVVAPAPTIAPPATPGAGPAQAPPVDQAAMSRAAGQIFAATDGWGTNEDAIHAALRGRSPAEIAAIKAEYQNHYGTSLDAVLAEELDGDDLASATAAMSADPVQAAAATLVRASNGLGTDEDAILSTLRGISDPGVRAQVEAEYARRTNGGTLSAMLADELGGTDAQVATSLSSGNTDEADAILLEDAMSGGFLGMGLGTDEDGINKVLEGCTDQAHRDRVAAAYQQRTKRSLQTDMADEMEGTDLQLSGALMTGDAAGAAAVRIQAAASGLGTDEDAIFQQLQVADPAQRAAVIAAYNTRFGGANGTNLDAMLADELGAMDGERATQLAANGRLDPVFAMRYAMDGIGTDEEMMRDALRGLDPTQAAQLQTDYAARYGGKNLQDEMRGELSGRDEFYISQSLGGERGLSTEERLRRADSAHDFERGSGAGVFGGFTDVFFDAGVQLDAQHNRLGVLREQMNNAATPDARAAAEQEIHRVLGYQDQDQDAYHAAQDSVANGAATGAAIVATVAVTAATGGLGAGAAVPALASFMASAGAATGIGATSLAMGAGALAGGLTSMAVKRSVSGEAYGAEAAGLDLAMTGVNALTAGAMASGAAVQGLPALLAEHGVGTFAPGVGGSFANTMATQLAQGAAQGLVSGTAQGLLDERTWRGPGNGVGNFLTTVGGNVASNMAGGAGQTFMGAAADQLNLFDPNTIRGSFGTGMVGGAAGGAAQTALTAGAFDGRWEDVATRFGTSMGTGGIQGGLMNAGQTVSTKRLEAQAMRLAAESAAPVVNPADQIPQEVIAGLPEEVQAVVNQAKEHPPGTGPKETGSPVNPTELAALSPELAQTVDAAKPVAPTAETPARVAPLTPEELFLQAQAAKADPAKGAAALSDRIPEVLDVQAQARVGADPELQLERARFETAMAMSPEARAAVQPTLDTMCEKAFDYIARTRTTPEAQMEALASLGMSGKSGLAGAVGTDPHDMLNVLASGNPRERGIALARFQELLGNDALAVGGIERMRAAIADSPQGAGHFSDADIARLEQRVAALDATGAQGKGRSAKALFSPIGADDTHAAYAAAKGQEMDAKMPGFTSEAVAAHLGTTLAPDAAPITGAGESSPIARTTMTVQEAQAAGYELTPREIAQASPEGVL